jgi:hypothetical protein
MNTSKIVSIVITTIAVALSVSSISFTGHVFAQKDDNSNSGGGSSGGSDSSSSSSGSSSGGSSSGSSKSDYDKFQSCLSDASNDGSATKQQIRDCFDSTYGGGSSGSSGSSDTNDNSGGSSDTGNSPNDNNNDASN